MLNRVWEQAAHMLEKGVLDTYVDSSSRNVTLFCDIFIVTFSLCESESDTGKLPKISQYRYTDSNARERRPYVTWMSASHVCLSVCLLVLA